MSLLVLFSVFLLCLPVGASPKNGTKAVGDDPFPRFLRSHTRRYSHGSLEFARRERLFRESIQRHIYLNSVFSSYENNSAIYGINQFSDLSPEEFKAVYLRSKAVKLPKYISSVKTSTKETSLPAKFDWRDKNFVAPVRNQLSVLHFLLPIYPLFWKLRVKNKLRSMGHHWFKCGGCWAFSIVGGIESVHAIKGNLLEELSVQQVIDCSYEDYGCNGGSTVSALDWLNKTQVKLVRASEYIFKAETGICHYFPSSEFGVSIRGYEAYNFRGCSLLDSAKLMGYYLGDRWLCLY
ncbi:cathepsin O isoform X3 [Rhinatrema bivittatum]|uniref:cathepsin O isoform X3 n=1 Tax=Rhinatrema bivittatum TaxID=194408 RepID=UPI00112EB114|nr:cathepsin O isoform X3 [Rhinatrema bivittatum]